MGQLFEFKNILSLLLVFVPIAIVLEYVVHARAEWIFVTVVPGDHSARGPHGQGDRASGGARR